MTGSLEAVDLPRLSLFVGGARSGKSAAAERFLSRGGTALVYLATAEPGDAEMAERIARHRADRAGRWQTVEAPLDLSGALAAVPAGSGVLVDCATLWLSNHLLRNSDLSAECDRLLLALLACPARAVAVVSNEVGWGIVPDNALARTFRDAQGRLNQRLAAHAELVVGVMAGLPFMLKGRDPGALFDHRS